MFNTLTKALRGIISIIQVIPSFLVFNKPLEIPSYILLFSQCSVTKASQTGKVVKFTKSACYILDRNHKIVAKATKVGSFYQLDHKPNYERVNVAKQPETKEDMWHKRYGHLGVSSLQKLANKNLVDGFDFNLSQDLTFCEACPQGKQH